MCAASVLSRTPCNLSAAAVTAGENLRTSACCPPLEVSRILSEALLWIGLFLGSRCLLETASTSTSTFLTEQSSTPTAAAPTQVLKVSSRSAKNCIVQQVANLKWTQLYACVCAQEHLKRFCKGTKPARDSFVSLTVSVMCPRPALQHLAFLCDGHTQREKAFSAGKLSWSEQHWKVLYFAQRILSKRNTHTCVRYVTLFSFCQRYCSLFLIENYCQGSRRPNSSKPELSIDTSCPKKTGHHHAHTPQREKHGHTDKKHLKNHLE